MGASGQFSLGPSVLPSTVYTVSVLIAGEYQTLGLFLSKAEREIDVDMKAASSGSEWVCVIKNYFKRYLHVQLHTYYQQQSRKQVKTRM